MLAAQLEEAERLRTNSLRATGDIEEAFDSVSKNALRLGDARSGVEWRLGLRTEQ